MGAGTTGHATRIQVYPAIHVASALKRELIDSIRAIARRNGMVVPKNDGSLVAANVEIDSLSVIEILCVLDEILPFEVGESVVRAGGYGSIQEAVDDVTASVEKEHKARPNGRQQRSPQVGREIAPSSRISWFVPGRSGAPFKGATDGADEHRKRSASD